ncbi:hypothetical protein [Parachryseolinea silvisoli]|uniref:hypothetical protein n=1 Tax=Parachryseolinea silvisoli TaxID=2873601 RepID=UPI002265C86A|nr:hypothetical protein [Parachryseolinea silvisoli]MCD9015180.1 hypothetical protein [Parachryseolinea silvisoli]
MNFILHFKASIRRIADDDRPKTQHLALYMVLFNEWNSNLFRNPVILTRSDIMRMSKIGSAHTYTRCLKDLSEWGYFEYHPSYDPQRSSTVVMYRFDTGTYAKSGKGTYAKTGKGTYAKTGKGTYAKTGKGGGKGSGKGTGKGTGKGDGTIYKNSTNLQNTINDINGHGTSNEDSNFVNDRGTDANPQATDTGNHRRKKQTSGGRGGGRADAIPATVQEAQEYFLAQQSTADEAEKFCNHYQANGWLIGGRSPMQDWRASARNWIKNSKKFAHENRQAHSKPKPGPLDTGPKNYGEPY